MRARAVPATLLVGYTLFLAWILLNPSPAVAGETVNHVASLLQRLGLPAALVAAGRVEFLLNAAMFAPLTMLTTLIWPRRSWTHWVAWAFVLSAAVELSQGLVLPSRSAQFVDVVANTLGALGGAGAMSLAVRA
ncbi:MAG: VanZ family protein, partial [Marmoricola sp.]